MSHIRSARSPSGRYKKGNNYSKLSAKYVCSQNTILLITITNNFSSIN